MVLPAVGYRERDLPSIMDTDTPNTAAAAAAGPAADNSDSNLSSSEFSSDSSDDESHEKSEGGVRQPLASSSACQHHCCADCYIKARSIPASDTAAAAAAPRAARRSGPLLPHVRLPQVVMGQPLLAKNRTPTEDDQLCLLTRRSLTLSTTPTLKYSNLSRLKKKFFKRSVKVSLRRTGKGDPYYR